VQVSVVDAVLEGATAPEVEAASGKADIHALVKAIDGAVNPNAIGRELSVERDVGQSVVSDEGFAAGGAMHRQPGDAIVVAGAAGEDVVLIIEVAQQERGCIGRELGERGTGEIGGPA